MCKGLAKLVIVDIALNRDQDNPQLIFESMNSTGRELSQADLIRNFILMGLEPQLQTQLYEQYWRPMEVDFGQEAYGTHFDGFMRHYLTVKTGEIPNVREVYEAFKAHCARHAGAGGRRRGLVADIRAFARYYCAMALGNETDADAQAAFHDLRELKVDVAYPVPARAVPRLRAPACSPQNDLLAAVRLVEATCSAVPICAIPTNSLNKTFATFAQGAEEGPLPREHPGALPAAAVLSPLPRRRRIPARPADSDLYNFRSRSYWLRRLENHGRKERVPVDEYTIEHILPQNENLSAAVAGGTRPGVAARPADWLHTLGNLTLTGYNSEYSDRPFAEKRDMQGRLQGEPAAAERRGSGSSTLERGRDPGARGAARRPGARQVWTAPTLDAGRPGGLQAEGASGARYTIEDHPHLADGRPTRGVRGVPQAGAGARPLRDRGVPEAVRRVQGRDQLRRRRATGEAAATRAQHAAFTRSRPARACART